LIFFFSKAKITCFEKTSFKLTERNASQNKTSYLNIQILVKTSIPNVFRISGKAPLIRPEALILLSIKVGSGGIEKMW